MKKPLKSNMEPKNGRFGGLENEFSGFNSGVVENSSF